MSEFNLVDEPWIRVMSPQGVTEVGLRGLFRESSVLGAFSNELATINLAIARLCLAISHDAVGFHSRSDIHALRQNGLDLDAIDAYLDQWKDSFWLFDKTRPFMQVADLRTAKGEVAGLNKIIADVPNGEPLFTTRLGPGLERISAAEAARWLVHAQAFEPSGIRSAAVGDPLTTNGKGYPTGPGWVGQIGGLIIHGKSLAETLVWNTVVMPEAEVDRPVWTQAPLTETRSEAAIVSGPLSLLTWQSRRIRLVGDAAGVTGVVIAQGDKMTPQNRQDVEFMTNWRYSEPQTKKFGRPVYMPAKHDPDRSFWRALPSVLAPKTVKVRDTPEVEAFMPAATLAAASDADRGAVLRVQAIGMTYGPQEATVEEVVNDSLDFHVALLAADSGELRTTFQEALSAAETAVRALGNLGSNIAKAAGESGESAGEGARTRVMQRAWAQLDLPARRWIAALNDESDPDDCLKAWQVMVRAELGHEARREYAAAPPASVSGRMARIGMNTMYMTVDIALNLFHSAMAKALPLAYEPQKEEA